ncbi:DUF2914 domain-containing protein [Methylobacter sp. S3L5C]|uniref:DUF2914 domain-containing protein n=1 Tax=Methylobacter sp. S3L5C TaxID=2839024 RepID=UPI001FADDE55|nr:DUF2914 domain-containing protein [Methylobacter sp. S3L5C]UOA08172.1 DUF2914 domain-containing protein [Methylobacter sp. S3L5C]
MEDKKSIVIKVKYPGNGKKTEDGLSTSKIITEWNIKRILLALLGVILLITALWFFFKPNAENTDLKSQAVLSEEVIKIPVKPNMDFNKNITITRALLTFNINNNEPVGKITLPLTLSKTKSTSIYYFVELSGMKDRTIYHEWLLDGTLITRKKVNISNDNWRTSSRQLFIYNIKTNWIARLVDESGQILNQIDFSINYE